MRPESPVRVLTCATWGGLAQLAGLATLLVSRYRAFMAVSAKPWEPLLAGKSEIYQSGAFIVSTISFLIHPISLVVLYFALEGLVRFVSGLVASEVTPSLPVFLAFRLIDRRKQRSATLKLESLPADIVEFFPDDRVRIASARPRPAWNSHITVGIGGRSFEIEKKEPGSPARPFVCILRPAPVGKVLRAYEEYDLDLATVVGQPEPRTSEG